MGLDIAAYSNLSYLGHHPGSDDDDHYYDPETYDRLHVEAYAYADFAHALMGVPNLRPLAGNSGSKFLSGGCFELTGKTETHRFQAGSYTGYNRWRQDLADRFNPYRDEGPPSPEGPFYELIWFADNEGTIGELAATKLLLNFRHFEAEYVAAHLGTDMGDYFVEKYADWTRACELAADGGLIDFH